MAKRKPKRWDVDTHKRKSKAICWKPIPSITGRWLTQSQARTEAARLNKQPSPGGEE